MPIACPDRESLAAWSLGCLEESRLEEIAEHISSCDSCLSTLEGLELPADRIVEEVRRPEIAGAAFKPIGDGTAEMCRSPREDEAEAGAGFVVPTAPAPGDRVGSYEILEELRRGGMGVVYRARHTRLGRVVALKVLPPAQFRDPRAVARFRREMQSAGAIDHPNVVRVSDAGEAGGVHYLAMEFIDGDDLDRLVRRGGALPVAMACGIVRQVAQALEHIQRKGLVHRDVKPSNIMMTRDGHVRLLDLGLALLRDGYGDGSEITASGLLLGTAAYMAPEQASDPRQVDIRADLYSLGCTLYFLLAGRPPFGGKDHGSPLRTLMAHAQEPAPSIASVRPEVPGSLIVVIERLMAKDTADRFQSPAEVVAALGPFCEEGPGLAVSADPESTAVQVSPASAPQHHPGRRLPPWKTKTLVALATIGALFVLWQIVIIIRDRNGKERRIVVEEGHTVIITETGGEKAPAPSPAASPKPATEASTTGVSTARSHSAFPDLIIEPEPVKLRPGEPMSAEALVQRPPALTGVRSWTIETSRNRGNLGPLAYSPDGRRLAISGHDGVVRILDAATGSLQRMLIGHAGPVHDLAWHRAGRILASGGEDMTVRLWDTESSRLLLRLEGQQHPVGTLAWSPDGTELATGSGGEVLVWEARTGRVVERIGGQAGYPWQSLAWAPDGKTIVLKNGETRWAIWDRSAQLHKADFDVGKRINRLTFSPDGTTLAISCTDQNLVELWDVGAGRRIRSMEQNYPVALAFSPAGSSLAVGQLYRTAICDPATGKEIRSLPNASLIFSANLAWSPDGKHLAEHAHQSNWIGIWEVGTGRRERNIQGYLAIDSVAWSPDAVTIVGATGNFTGFWETATGRLQGVSSNQPGMMAISPDGRKIAYGRHDVVRIEELATRQEVACLRRGAQTQTLAWSPDSKRLAIGEVAALRVMDAVTGTAICWSDGQNAPANAVAWSPDGRLLAASDGGRVRIFDADSGKPIRTVEGDESHVFALLWWPDGKRLAAGDFKGRIRIWEADTGRLRETWGKKDQPVASLAWRPGGRTIVSSGFGDFRGSTFDEWEAASGRLLRSRMLKGRQVSLDGARIAGWDNSTIQFHAFEDGRLLNSIVSLEPPNWLVVSADGHYRGSRGVESDIVYVVQTDRGQEMLTPAEFSARYGWKNDPSRVATTQ